jgi:alanyl-tRNA synthetase
VREGKELYSATGPGEDGLRRVIEKGSIDDAMRARAQAFVSGSKALFLVVSEDPPSLLLAASADSGFDAGKMVKAAVAKVGGRGGGNQTLAQASVPDSGALETVRAELSLLR